MINVNVIVRKVRYAKKIIFGIMLHVIVKIENIYKYYGWFSDYIWWKYRMIQWKTNSNEKEAICKMQNFYILLAFSLITIALLIAISFYCYLIKYRAKKETLLPCCDANNESGKSFMLKNVL